MSENLHANLDLQVTCFHQNLPPEGDLATKLYTSDEQIEIEVVYTSDKKGWNRNSLHFWSKNVEIEIVYASDQKNVEIEIVYTSAQIHDFRTIKRKHTFAVYFPNVDVLMTKGKHLLLFIFQMTIV